MSMLNICLLVFVYCIISLCEVLFRSLVEQIEFLSQVWSMSNSITLG